MLASHFTYSRVGHDCRVTSESGACLYDSQHRKKGISMTRLLCGFFLLLLGCPTWAVNLLQNGSFELGAANPCFIFDIPAGSTLITGWTVSVGTIDW